MWVQEKCICKWNKPSSYYKKVLNIIIPALIDKLEVKLSKKKKKMNMNKEITFLERHMEIWFNC